MKTMFTAVIGVILCVSALITDVHAEDNATVELHKNVRIVLEISEGDKPTTTFAIVGSEGRLSLDNIANLVKIDDSDVPTILSFDIVLNPKGNSLYTIEYSYGFQMPVVTGIITSKDGKKSSRYEYKSLGAQGTVNMAIGDKLEVLKDPKRSVVLKLESADNVAE